MLLNKPNNAINHRAFHALDFKPQAVIAGIMHHLS